MQHNLGKLYRELREATVLLQETWQCYQSCGDSNIASKCAQLYMKSRANVVQIIFSIKMLCDAYMIAELGKNEVAAAIFETILYNISIHDAASTIALTELYNMVRRGVLPPENDKLRTFIREIEEKHIMEADKIATLVVEGKVSIEKILEELKCM